MNPIFYKRHIDSKHFYARLLLQIEFPFQSPRGIRFQWMEKSSMNIRQTVSFCVPQNKGL